MPVSTRTAEHRTLRFDSFAEVRRDLDALEAAQRAGTLRTTGNWTPGQIFTHLAAFIDYGFDGYPPQLNPPFFVKWFLRMKKREFLARGLPRGVKIPRIQGGTVGMEDVPFDEGLVRLRGALDRLEASPPTHDSPGFGPMPHADVIGFACRHCELHLGYVHPR